MFEGLRKRAAAWGFGLAAMTAAAPAFAQAEGAATGQHMERWNWQMDLIEAATPVKEQMHWFHNGVLLPLITAISIFVLILLIWVVIRYRAGANPNPATFTHNTTIEVVWTLVPVAILIAISIPSFRLIYFADRAVTPEMTLKVTGHQWYWDYEYPDHGAFTFSAYMIPDNEIKDRSHRLLDTDNPVVVPVGTTIRVLVTAADVLHSFAVPAFGIKTDAVPGRINETWIRIEKPGVYYGQCSELCGTQHGFMPIEVHAVSKEEFTAWVETAKQKFASNTQAPVTVAAAPAEAATPSAP
jgi:cytochrome c oxidase subunit 2